MVRTAPSQTDSAAQGTAVLRPPASDPVNRRFYQSPVDYEAWAKGYLPPSDHLLIDELMFRGARPIMSSDNGKDGAWWFVIRGKFPGSKTRLAIYKLLCEADDWPEPESREELDAAPLASPSLPNAESAETTDVSDGALASRQNARQDNGMNT